MLSFDRLLVVVILASISSLVVTGTPTIREVKNGFSLQILHTNDMHARFEETLAPSSPEKGAAKKGYGGFPRLATLIRQARNSSTPTLFLNAGDTYQGTIWFNIHKWKIVSKFLDILSPDAISLGNHEFDDGIPGLLPFINAAKYPIVTANLDLTEEPELSSSKLRNSTIITINGTKIGVIGYLTPETRISTPSGNVKFLDEVESIKREVTILKNKGVKILIALGHSGYTADKKIASEVDGIDLVIGGHTHTFLYNGKSPDREMSKGFYPTEIIQKNGRKVYVVQAFAYTKYLGNITIDFDDNGEVTKILGNPILVDDSILQAQDVLDELETWRTAINEVTKKVIGSTKVFLEGNNKVCRKMECNLGNLIADAMVDYNALEYVEEDSWTDTAISFHSAGTMRNSINKNLHEKITAGDVLVVLPFNNSLVKITLNGSKLIEVLEWSVENLEPNSTANLPGQFLQMSGIHVVYDLSQPSGSRIFSVDVRCASCTVPTFEKLENNAMYNILTDEFLRGGGDGYSMLMDLKYEVAGKTTDEIVIDYLKTKSPVHPDVEGRIKYLIKTRSGTIVSTDPGASSDADSAGGSTSFNVKRVLKASTYSYWD